MIGLTWLHLSDWHHRGKDFNRLVVRDALIEDLQNRVSISSNLSTIDFIIFSGDIAFSGQKEEYDAAIEHLFKPVLEAVDLTPDRLFIVPGNHDLNRKQFDLLPKALLQPFTSEEEVQNWLTDERKRRRLLEPFEAYHQFASMYTGQQQLAYTTIHILEINSKQIALLGLNSALMCGRNTNIQGEVSDYGYLVVGEPQLHDALKEIGGADVRIAVLHHPFDWLTEFDRTRIEERLGHSCHFILCGHQHMPKVNLVRGTTGGCLIIPAGASYDRRVATDARYVNAYNFVHLDFAGAQGIVYLRRWSDRRTMWLADTDTYPGGQFMFPFTASDSSIRLSEMKPAAIPPLKDKQDQQQIIELQKRIQTTLSNHAVIDHTELFGVDEVIKKLKKQLVNLRGDWVISLAGEGGIGKTALAYEIVSRYVVEAGFTRIAWISAKTAQFLPSGELLRKTSAEYHWTTIIKKIADQLNLEIGYSAIEWINDFHKGLQRVNDKCLIIIYNLETIEYIAEAIQYLCGTTNYQLPRPHKLIITTRYSVLRYTSNAVETELKGLKPQDVLQFIHALGNELSNEDIKNANDEELGPILEATEGNPFLIKLCVRRFLASHLPLDVVLRQLKEANKLISKNVILYLYSESLSVLEQRCGKEAAKHLMAAFCPLGAGNPVDYLSLFKHSHIGDADVFSSTLETACNLSLVRASNLNRVYSIHSLLWNYLCDPSS